MAATTFYQPDRRQPAATRSCWRCSSSPLLGCSASPSATPSSATAGRRPRARRRALVLGGAVAVGTYFAGDRSSSPSGAREVDRGRRRRSCMNVVRELAIAANIPMPKVYIIDDTAPNAFATGRDPQHASIAITTGLLEKLDREELQGVIGHELSHVRNSTSGSRCSSACWSARSRCSPTSSCASRSGAAAAAGRATATAAAAAAPGRSSSSSRIVLAILAPIIAGFVQLAVSRQREYLADASSVELTRNPYGLERALAKISADQEVLEVANRGDPAPVLHEPDQEVRGARVGPDVDPPADPRPDQPAARADRRGAARRRPTRRALTGLD